MNAALSHSGKATLAWLLVALGAFAAQAQAPAAETLQQKQTACTRGDLAACVRAGRAHDRGEGTAVNKAAALPLYRRACDGKNGDGCGLAGWLIFTGQGATKDFDAGYALMEKGCDELRSGESCYIMSVVNLDSKHQELVELGGRNLMAACAHGYTDGCYELGMNFLKGTKGFAHDAAGAALIWETQACDKGHALSCAAAGYEFEHNEEIKRDPARAVKLYQKSCDAGDAVGCTYLGEAFANAVGGLAANPAKAAQLYASSCERGVGYACSRLSTAYRKGSGVQLDVARADALTRTACELSSSQCGLAATAAAAAPSFRIARMQLGVDTVASVERDIAARGGSPSRGGGGGSRLTLNALTGDYRDSGPDIMAVNYDFDSADPTGRLVAVTIVRQRSVNAGPAQYATLVAERKAAITKEVGPMQQKSATEYTATSSNGGMQVTLRLNADIGFLYETFKAVDTP